MTWPSDIATVITRAEFRKMIDPLLDALGFRAEQVKSLSFNSDGFEIEAFDLTPEDRRVVVCGDSFATQTIRIHIARSAVS